MKGGGTHRVVVTREGARWLADVPELPGAYTFADNVEFLDEYVREVIVFVANLPDDAGPGLELIWQFP